MAEESNDDLIEALKMKPFLARGEDEKEMMLRRGRPRPDLGNLTSYHNEKSSGYTRRFRSKIYDRVSWLCGGRRSQRLFCWPCILYGGKSSSWTGEGFTNLNNLTQAVHKHEISKPHLNNFMRLNETTLQLKRDHNERVKRARHHNDQVVINRRVVYKLIDVIVFLADKLFVTSNSDPQSNSYYKAILELMAFHETGLKKDLDTSNFDFASPGVQDDLTRAVSDVVRAEINEEVERSRFVSMILTERGGEATSVTIRYVCSETGRTLERFLSVTEDKKSLKHHLEFLRATIGNETKIISISYDSFATKEELSDVLSWSHLLLVHSHDHDLVSILAKATYALKECRFFFITLNHFTLFLNEIRNKRPNQNATVLSKLNLLTTLNYLSCNREHCIELLNNIISNSIMHESTEATIQAPSYKAYLTNPINNFLASLFLKIFDLIQQFQSEINQNAHSQNYYFDKVTKTKQTLVEWSNNDFFLEFWNESQNIYNSQMAAIKKEEEEISSNCSHLHREILRLIVDEIDVRFEYQGQLRYLETLDRYRVSDAKFKIFSDQIRSRDDIFDGHRLKNELQVISTHDQFKKKSLTELTEHLRKNDIDSVLKETYKLCTYISTLPIHKATTDSVLKRINAYKSIHKPTTDHQNAILILEKDLLKELHEKINFNDRVFAGFCNQKTRLEFTYETLLQRF